MRIALGWVAAPVLALAVQAGAQEADWVERTLTTNDEVYARWITCLCSPRQNVTNNVDAGLAIATNLAADLMLDENSFEDAAYWCRVSNLVDCAVILNIHKSVQTPANPTEAFLGAAGLVLKQAKDWTTLVLHEERPLCPPSRPNVYSDYLLEVDHVAVLWVAADTNALPSLPEDFLKTRLLDSQFKTSFKQLRAIAAKMTAQGAPDRWATPTVLYVRAVLLARDRIRAPSEITLSYTDQSAGKRTFYNHEEVSWDLQVGLALHQSTELKPGKGLSDIGVGSDTVRKRETDGGFLALLEYHAPRDADRWLLPTYWTRRDFWRRFGAVAGLDLSGDPLSKLYVGASFSLSHSTALTAGAIWAEEKGAGSGGWFDKSYADATWFVGLSVSPGRILSQLSK